MKILHIAPFNTANVPLTFVRAERAMGHESRLVTLHRHEFKFEEDICLNLPFLDSPWSRTIKRFAGISRKTSVFSMVPPKDGVPLKWKPHNFIEKMFHILRDRIWEQKIAQTVERYNLDQFDLYQLDGGLGFFRSGKYINMLHKKGKTIICCYLGSDLRIRGVIPEIDSISSKNFTVEFDLQQWYPGITYVSFPFDADSVGEAQPDNPPPVIIGHAPSNRAAKGSDVIIEAVHELQKSESVSLSIIEGLEHHEALNLKRKCHIFVDQLGPLGYGINTLESLAMGIPACSSLAPGFAAVFPGNPIFEITPSTIGSVLLRLIHDPELRKSSGMEGREWVRKAHDPQQVVRKIHHDICNSLNK